MSRSLILTLMETPASQITCSNEDVNSALIALARLLGRQAAKELVEAEQADPVTPLNKDEGARND